MVSMKICILSHPRSGSSYIQQLLALYYNLENLEEVFTNMSVTDGIQHLSVTDDFIVKIICHNLPELNLNDLNLHTYDKIVVVERKNLLETFISWAAAQHTNRWYKNKQAEQFTLDKRTFVKNSHHMNYFWQMKDFLTNNNIIFDHVYYEDIEQDIVKCFIDMNLDPTKAADLPTKWETSVWDYRTDCLNYNKVDKWVTDYIQWKKDNI